MPENERLECGYCLNQVKVHVKCYLCEAMYHPNCLGKQKGFQIDHNGRMFCCSNINPMPKKEEISPTKSSGVDSLEKKEEGKRFKCDKCPFSTAWYSSLKQHSLTHYNIRRYECDICKKRFKQNAQLYCHKRVHMNKKYKCTYCSFESHYSSSINKHKIKVHKVLLEQ